MLGRGFDVLDDRLVCVFWFRLELVYSFMLLENDFNLFLGECKERLD